MFNNLKSRLTARTLIIFGFVLIIAGNAFSREFLNIRIHELLANVGALILIVGVLQWFFDEEAREDLIQRISTHIDGYLSRRDNLGRAGVSECLMDSQAIVAEPWATELIEARTVVIGIHYSDRMIVRFESIIHARIAQNKITQVLHSNADGIAKPYLETCLSVAVDLREKVERLQQLVSTRFNNSNRVRMLPHNRVLRYSFVFSERALWLIFLTNTDGYEPAIPTLRVAGGTPLFEFFKRDIQDLGAAL